MGLTIIPDIHSRISEAVRSHGRVSYELERARTAARERGATFARQRDVESLTAELERRRLYARQVLEEALALSYERPGEYQDCRHTWTKKLEGLA